MNIEVRFRGIEPSDALRDHASRRIHSHFSRFDQEITAVLVRISDINGPKGGIDKRCQVTVRGPLFGSATLDDLSGDAYSAIDMAVERVGQMVGRELERLSSDKRSRPPPRSVE